MSLSSQPQTTYGTVSIICSPTLTAIHEATISQVHTGRRVVKLTALRKFNAGLDEADCTPGVIFISAMISILGFFGMLIVLGFVVDRVRNLLAR